jgi:hypothetical protein
VLPLFITGTLGASPAILGLIDGVPRRKQRAAVGGWSIF